MTRLLKRASRWLLDAAGDAALWLLMIGEWFQDKVSWFLGRRLTLYFAIVAVVWYVYHRFHVYVSTRVDGVLLGAMAITLFECALVMVFATRYWRVRAMGVFGLVLGTGILYTTVSLGSWGVNIGHKAAIIDLARSFFLTTAAFLGYGVNKYIWDHRQSPPAWWHRDDSEQGDEFLGL
jgi:hypothetical protein